MLPSRRPSPALLLALLLPLGACSKGAVPDHLRSAAPSQARPTVSSFDTLEQLIAAIVRRDPLARTPTAISPEAASTAPDSEAVAAFLALVQEQDNDRLSDPEPFHRLERSYPGTAAVALSRGYRLRSIEGQVAALQGFDVDIEKRVLAMMSPLRPSIDPNPQPLRPLQWMAETGSVRDGVMAWGDPWALAGWLAGPHIPVGPAAAALEPANYDSLRDSPIGQLVLARAAAPNANASDAWIDLERATTYALHRAAADRDSEQEALKEQRAELRLELGLDAEDPAAALLDRAFRGFLLDAGSSKSTGAALLAAQAARWTGACPDRPCIGLDRVESMGHATRWHADLEALVAVWKVIALKESLDFVETARNTVLFNRSMVQLTDALLGTGATAPPMDILQKRSPNNGVWLALCRAVHGEPGTKWEDAKAALTAHLHAQVLRAQQVDTQPARKKWLETLARRSR